MGIVPKLKERKEKSEIRLRWEFSSTRNNLASNVSFGTGTIMFFNEKKD